MDIKSENTCDKYSRSVFLKFTKQLCSDLHLKSTNYFEVPDNSELPDLNTFICELLQCNSISKIPEVIKMYIPVDSADLEMDSSEERNPSLGDLIPERLHYILDQSLDNFFYPEEWVGYENEHEKIVYAKILCELVQRKAHKTSPVQRKYIISTGLDEGNIEVPAVQLFKFTYNKSTDKSARIVEMDVYDGPSTSEHAEQSTNTKIGSKKKKAKNITIDKKKIREAVKDAWALPEEQRRKALKRLYLQHHPDKNPDNPNATAEFQYLQQEIERLGNGISEDEADGRGTTFGHPQASNSTWRSWFDQWNHTASSHSYYRHRDQEASSRGGMPYGHNIPQSQPDINEAKLWIGQAKYDYSALCVLRNASQTNNEIAAATCFMCHEVAEKSLKAGMYATRGLSSDSLKKHNLESSASALIQMKCLVKIEDARFLERFYLDTRFPNRYSPHVIPGEQFSSDTARQGFKAATRIYETVKQMI